MTEYFNTWDDGEKKWIKKVGRIYKDREITLSSENMLPVSLMACDIKTDVQNQSWMIVHNNVMYKHYENKSINYWALKDNIITLYFSDGTYYKLLFFTPSEAIKADLRLFLIMNGNIIVGCNDTDAFVCANVLGLNVSFFECMDVTNFIVLLELDP